MVCLPQETNQSFVSQSSPELTALRLIAGTSVLVCELPSLALSMLAREGWNAVGDHT